MLCEELGYGAFGEWIGAQTGGKRTLLSATLGLTERCNLRCQHCFVHDPARDAELKTKELDAGQWAAILDQLAGMGCLWLTMTGGEILVHPDFAEIYLQAKQRGFLVTLLTNGTLLTPDLIELFQEWYPLSVEISLYGSTRETYGEVTGVPGAFDRSLWAAKALVEAGVELRLKTVAMTLTKGEIQAMYDFSAELGVPFRHDGNLWQTFHAKDIGHLRLAPTEVVELDSLIPGVGEEYRRLHEMTLEYLRTSPRPKERRLYQCGAGIGSCFVDPYGGLGLCQMSHHEVYGLNTGTLSEGWALLAKEREVTTSKQSGCQDCGLLSLCQNCPARAKAETGDPESVSGYACAIAHRRARELALPDKASVLAADGSGDLD